MSNVSVVREVYAAFARRDMRRGHAGFLEWARIGREAEDIEVLEPQLFLTSEDAVAVVGHMKCRAMATGRVYESDFVHLVSVRDGMITRFQEFFDTYAAAEAFRAPRP